jgi:hypothetical protein
MLKSVLAASLFIVCHFSLSAQDQEKIQVISRTVEGEIRTLYNDTLYGEIKVSGATDYYITSIEFKEKGKKKVTYSAFDIKRFKQIVPYPDRPKFGVEEVYYEGRQDPENSYKKYFYPIPEWK